MKTSLVLGKVGFEARMTRFELNHIVDLRIAEMRSSPQKPTSPSMFTANPRFNTTNLKNSSNLNSIKRHHSTSVSGLVRPQHIQKSESAFNNSADYFNSNFRDYRNSSNNLTEVDENNNSTTLMTHDSKNANNNLLKHIPENIKRTSNSRSIGNLMENNHNVSQRQPSINGSNTQLDREARPGSLRSKNNSLRKHSESFNEKSKIQTFRAKNESESSNNRNSKASKKSKNFENLKMEGNVTSTNSSRHTTIDKDYNHGDLLVNDADRNTNSSKNGNANGNGDNLSSSKRSRNSKNRGKNNNGANAGGDPESDPRDSNQSLNSNNQNQRDKNSDSISNSKTDLTGSKVSLNSDNVSGSCATPTSNTTRQPRFKGNKSQAPVPNADGTLNENNLVLRQPSTGMIECKGFNLTRTLSSNS